MGASNQLEEHLMQGIHNENETLIMKGGMNWRNIQEVSDDGDVMVKGVSNLGGLQVSDLVPGWIMGP